MRLMRGRAKVRPQAASIAQGIRPSQAHEAVQRSWQEALLRVSFSAAGIVLQTGVSRPIRGSALKGLCAMLFLVAATLFSSSFGLIVRYAQERRCNLWGVGAVNYTLAATFHAVLWALSGAGWRALDASTVALGVGGGIVFVTAFGLLLPVMRWRGVSISTAATQLAVLVPVLFSVLLWGERPTTPQMVGATLALAALPMLGLQPGALADRMPARNMLLLLALFLTNGLCMLTVRAYQQVGDAASSSAFLTIIFGTAAVIAQIAWATRRDGSPSRELLPGAALGLCNALANLALINALARLPSMLVFPFQSAVGLTFASLMARLLWDERISRLEKGGMALALIAVAVINVG